MKLKSLQMGRALAAEYVVLYHIGPVLHDKLNVHVHGTFIDNLFLNAGHAGVEFFFVLSGFIIMFIHGKDIGRPDQVPRYATNRFLRIYPVFWIVLALFVLGQVAVASIDPLLRTPANIVRAILLIPFPTYPPVTVAWTLSHELLFYIIFGLCIFWRRAGMVILAVWLSGCVAADLLMLVSGTTPGFPLSFVFSPYNVLFAMGILAALSFGRLTYGQSLALTVLGLILFGAVIVHDASWPLPLVVTLYGAASMCIIAGLARLEELGRLRPPKWIVFLGDASYATYLLHSSAMAFLLILLRKAGIAKFTSLPVLFLILVLAGTAAGALFHILVERPLLTRLRPRRQRPVFATGAE